MGATRAAQPWTCSLLSSPRQPLIVIARARYTECWELKSSLLKRVWSGDENHACSSIRHGERSDEMAVATTAAVHELDPQQSDLNDVKRAFLRFLHLTDYVSIENVKVGQ